MSNNKSTAEKVKKLIAEILVVDEQQLTPSATLVEDLGADSVDQVEIIMALEETFDLEISESDAEKVKTVQDAVEYIEKRVAR